MTGDDAALYVIGMACRAYGHRIQAIRIRGVQDDALGVAIAADVRLRPDATLVNVLITGPARNE
jgi:hypothetical protein